MFDKCHKCDGLWLDRGELERLIESGQTSVEKQLEEKYGNPEFETEKLAGYMRCPRCQGRLQEITFTFTTRVRIDRCDQCLGVWIDAQELDRILGEKVVLDNALASPAFTRAIKAFFSARK
jgi:Zn-finger nucleic acid-binding protein